MVSLLNFEEKRGVIKWKAPPHMVDESLFLPVLFDHLSTYFVDNLGVFVEVVFIIL